MLYFFHQPDVSCAYIPSFLLTLWSFIRLYVSLHFRECTANSVFTFQLIVKLSGGQRTYHCTFVCWNGINKQRSISRASTINLFNLIARVLLVNWKHYAKTLIKIKFNYLPWLCGTFGKLHVNGNHQSGRFELRPFEYTRLRVHITHISGKHGYLISTLASAIVNISQ